MIERLLAALGIDHRTWYCENCAGFFPLSHFPCD